MSRHCRPKPMTSECWEKIPTPGQKGHLSSVHTMVDTPGRGSRSRFLPQPVILLILRMLFCNYQTVNCSSRWRASAQGRRSEPWRCVHRTKVRPGRMREPGIRRSSTSVPSGAFGGSTCGLSTEGCLCTGAESLRSSMVLRISPFRATTISWQTGTIAPEIAWLRCGSIPQAEDRAQPSDFRSLVLEPMTVF